MTATEIKVILLQKGIRQKDLAERWGKPTSTVSRIVNKTLQSRNLEKKLARVCGVTFEELRNGDGQ